MSRIGAIAALVLGATLLSLAGVATSQESAPMHPACRDLLTRVMGPNWQSAEVLALRSYAEAARQRQCFPLAEDVERIIAARRRASSPAAATEPSRANAAPSTPSASVNHPAPSTPPPRPPPVLPAAPAAECPIGSALGWIDVIETRQGFLVSGSSQPLNGGRPPRRQTIIDLSDVRGVPVHALPNACVLTEDCRYSGVLATGRVEIVEMQRISQALDGNVRWQMCVRQR